MCTFGSYLYKVKKQKENLFKDFLIVAVAVIYLLIAVTHILYLPCLTQSVKATSAQNSIFKRKVENIIADHSRPSLLQRTYKFVLEKKKSLTSIISSVNVFFVVLFLVPLIRELKPRYPVNSPWPTIHQHTLLSLCTLKI